MTKLEFKTLIKEILAEMGGFKPGDKVIFLLNPRNPQDDGNGHPNPKWSSGKIIVSHGDKFDLLQLKPIKKMHYGVMKNLIKGGSGSSEENQDPIINVILTKLKKTQEGVKEGEGSDVNYYSPGKEVWTKQYDRGFGIFMVTPRSEKFKYSSVRIVPRSKEMKQFDVNLVYEINKIKKNLNFENINFSKVLRILTGFKN